MLYASLVEATRTETTGVVRTRRRKERTAATSRIRKKVFGTSANIESTPESSRGASGTPSEPGKFQLVGENFSTKAKRSPGEERRRVVRRVEVDPSVKGWEKRLSQFFAECDTAINIHHDIDDTAVRSDIERYQVHRDQVSSDLNLPDARERSADEREALIKALTPYVVTYNRVQLHVYLQSDSPFGDLVKSTRYQGYLSVASSKARKIRA